MGMKRTHDAVYVEKYTDRSGQEKKRYTNIGALLTRDDGSMAIKLEAIPVNFSGWIALYEPKPRDGEQRESKPAHQSSAPAQRDSGGSLDSDEIPFASPITRRSWSVL